MTWELIEVTTEPEWQQDGSGVYVVVHRVEEPSVHKGISGVRIAVRVDLMTCSTDEPLRSWIGDSEAVRKAVMQWIDGPAPRGSICRLSGEHAAYIGSEIARAASDPNYVQR